MSEEPPCYRELKGHSRRGSYLRWMYLQAGGAMFFQHTTAGSKTGNCLREVHSPWGRDQYQRISCFPPVPLISMTLFNQISNRWLLKGLKDYFLAWARAHAILVVPPWQKVICWDMLTLMMVVGSINLELFKEILTSDPRAWTGSSHYLHVCSRGRLLFSIAG